MTLSFNQITIIGVGHIGGSIGLALRSRGFNGKIIGIGRTKSNLKNALEIGAIDEIDGENLLKSRNSELIVLCTPVRTFPFWFNQIKKFMRAEWTITDAGSVKENPVRWAKENKIDEFYVPAHPIAGKETSGAISADAELFKNKICIITPVKTERGRVNKVKNFWRFIGCKTIMMTPKMHDVLLSYTSHLPHVLAFALIGVLLKKYRKDEIISGGGLRDFTRIAGSSPEMWRDIFLGNQKNIMRAIKDIKDELSCIEELIKGNRAENLYNYLARSREFRKGLFRE